MRKIRLKKCFSLLLVLVLVVATLLIGQAGTTSSGQNAAKVNDSLLQFSSGGHVLGFGPTEVYLAGLDHALKVEFIEANPVQPEAQNTGLAENGTVELEKVTYNGLWEEIDLIYSAASGGIAESTYIIHPGGDPADISLRYNVPVELTPQGGLSLTFSNGYMTESPPVAWQEIDDKKIWVDVQFKLLNKNEAGFTLGMYDPAHAVFIDPVYEWHTFYGSANEDYGSSIALDSDGNIYVAGYSRDTWDGPDAQSPLNEYTGDFDIVVVKLDSSGLYQWHTFYGGSGYDYSTDISLDSHGNVYVTGGSQYAWDGPDSTLPLNAHSSGTEDIVVVKLDSSGMYQWHTFYGGSGLDRGQGITLDSHGNVYVAGESQEPWDGPDSTLPLNAHSSGTRDIVVVKLDSSGVYQWHTFYGGSGVDRGQGITLDSHGNVYVTGGSQYAWDGPDSKPPLNAHSSSTRDIVVIKLDSSGAYQWHTFYGHSGNDSGLGITLDSHDNVYVTGWSVDTWDGPAGEEPLNEYAGGRDLVIVKLDSTGAYQWHTFYGGLVYDVGWNIAVDSHDNIYVVGDSDDSWDGPDSQSPIYDYTGDCDIVVVKLDSSGLYQWHAFYGGPGYDYGYGIAVNCNDDIYLSGGSDAPWDGPNFQPPLSPHSGDYDLVIVKTKPDKTVKYNMSLFSNPEEGGTVTDLTDESPYIAGAEVRIQADPNEGYIFSHWSADTDVSFDNENATETTFIMPEQDVTVTANFTKEIVKTKAFGFYDHSAGQVYVKYDHTPGAADATYRLGPRGNNWQVRVGDFNGDNRETFGFYDHVAGRVYVKYDHNPGAADATYRLGPRGNNWKVLVGDFNGDGQDTFGFYDHADGRVYVKYDHSAGAADATYRLGPRGNNWEVFVGDFNGDGKDTFGFYDRAAGRVYVKYDHTPGAADATYRLGPRGNNWKVFVGDFNGDGKDTFGFYDHAGGQVYAKYDHTPGAADATYRLGPRGNNWEVRVGDYNGNGIDTFGFYDRAAGRVYVKYDHSAGAADATYRLGPRGNNWEVLVGSWR